MAFLGKIYFPVELTIFLSESWPASLWFQAWKHTKTWASQSVCASCQRPYDQEHDNCLAFSGVSGYSFCRTWRDVRFETFEAKRSAIGELCVGRFWGMNQFYNTRGVIRALATVAVLSLAALTSEATQLTLAPDPAGPDFTISLAGVTYTDSSDLFNVVGYTTGYTNGSVALVDANIYNYGYTYDLSATISSAGTLSSGSLTIQGDVGSGLQTLLTGSLNPGAQGTAWGSTNSFNSEFQFLFTVTGGTVAADFGGIGALNRGVLLHPFFAGGWDGAWTHDFSNDGFSGDADNFVQVPEPSSYILLVLAGALAVATHRSRKHSRMLKLA